MIFVTVGTHEQPFNRLVKTVDELKRDGVITEDVIMQTGFSTYEPKYCQWSRLIPYQQMIRNVEDARIVITHGGPASFIMPLQIAKTPIVVPRQHRFDEHVNNHQVEFARNVAERMGTIIPVEDINKLGEIIKNYDEIVAKMGHGMISNNEKFCKELENIVFSKANSKIRIVNNQKNENVKITYIFDEDSQVLLNQIDIVASKNINVVIEYKSETEKECFHAGIIRTFASDGANINVTVVNLLNDVSTNIESYENDIEADSKVYHKLIDIGAKASISNYFSNAIGNRADNDLKTIYLGQGSQVKDLNYIVHLRGEKTNVDIDVQGALKDSSKKNFKGTIDFKKGCKKAKGNENEYCMLLSDKAKSIALPMLLCTEADVEGNHSTASGKVDESAVFYIMSRGLSYKEAVRLLVKANFNKIIEEIQDEEVKTEILQEIDKRL